jgi:4'-phosphopantetheinyl transferase
MKVLITATAPRSGESLHDAAHRLLEDAAQQAGRPLPLQLDLLPSGKPFLSDAPHFHFNLSHSGGWAVCAVASCPVGIDLQEERPLRAAVSKRFSPQEQAMLAALPESAFFDVWALKEAGAKCSGHCGMRGVLHGSQVTLSPLSLGIAGVQAQLLDFPVEGLHLALAAQTEEPLEIELHLTPSATEP